MTQKFNTNFLEHSEKGAGLLFVLIMLSSSFLLAGYYSSYIENQRKYAKHIILRKEVVNQYKIMASLIDCSATRKKNSCENVGKSLITPYYTNSFGEIKALFNYKTRGKLGKAGILENYATRLICRDNYYSLELAMLNPEKKRIMIDPLTAKRFDWNHSLNSVIRDHYKICENDNDNTENLENATDFHFKEGFNMQNGGNEAKINLVPKGNKITVQINANSIRTFRYTSYPGDPNGKDYDEKIPAKDQETCSFLVTVTQGSKVTSTRSISLNTRTESVALPQSLSHEFSVQKSELTTVSIKTSGNEGNEYMCASTEKSNFEVIVFEIQDTFTRGEC